MTEKVHIDAHINDVLNNSPDPDAIVLANSIRTTIDRFATEVKLPVDPRTSSEERAYQLRTALEKFLTDVVNEEFDKYHGE